MFYVGTPVRLPTHVYLRWSMHLTAPLLAGFRLARLSVHLLHGMAVMALRFPSLDEAGRQARIGWWSAGVLRAMGVALHVTGTARPGATLLLANHVSWLDIAALHADRKSVV